LFGYLYSAPHRRSFDALTTVPLLFDQTFLKFDGQIPVHLGFFELWFCDFKKLKEGKNQLSIPC
jgi:hypothetical protein